MAASADAIVRRRWPVMIAMVGVHMALILWLAARAEHPLVRGEPAAMSVSQIDAPPEPAAPVPLPPPPPALPALLPPAVPDPAPPASSASTASAAADAPCAPLEQVGAALAADPAVRAALSTVPADARSIAGAIVVWNGDWAAVAGSPDAPLASVRATVLATLSALPEGCLLATVAGPRLVPIGGADGTSILVFGSGEWRWRQVLGAANAMKSFDR